MRKIIFVACILMVAVEFQSSAAATPGDSGIVVSDSANLILKHLPAVLAENKNGARIYYQAICKPENVSPHALPQSIQFPQISVEPPAASMRGISAIRGMFRSTDNVLVTERSSGVVRILIGNFSSAILKTKIPLFVLTPLQQYNPLMVISALSNTKEMARALHKLGVRPIVRFQDYPLVPASVELPHLPSTMKDVTIDKVLDSVADVFGGVVFYGACAQPRVFDINFVSLGH